jgi:hypothetical protein
MNNEVFIRLIRFSAFVAVILGIDGGCGSSDNRAQPCLVDQDCPQQGEYCDTANPGPDMTNMCVPTGMGTCRTYNPAVTDMPCTKNEDCESLGLDVVCFGETCGYDVCTSFAGAYPAAQCPAGCRAGSRLSCQGCYCSSCPAPADAGAADSSSGHDGSMDVWPDGFAH